MIVSSTYKPIAYFTIISSIVLELFLMLGIVVLMSAFFQHPIISVGAVQWHELLVMLLMAVVLGWIVFVSVIQNAHYIQIDIEHQSIECKTFITRQTIQFSKNHLTSYSIVTVPSKIGNYSMVCLKSDDQIVHTISGFYYSNLPTLITAIHSFLPLYKKSAQTHADISNLPNTATPYQYQCRKAFGSDALLIEFVSNTNSPLFLNQLLDALKPLEIIVADITDQWVNDEVWINVECSLGKAIITKDIYECVFIMAKEQPSIIHAIDGVLAKHPLFEKVKV
ncbi:MAG: hypothetical protein ACOYKE_04555 [Ferruginibacter sp.]